jgi:hypothetical protein
MIGDAQEEAGEQGKQLAILAAGLVELRAAAPPVGLGRIVPPSSNFIPDSRIESVALFLKR